MKEKHEFYKDDARLSLYHLKFIKNLKREVSPETFHIVEELARESAKLVDGKFLAREEE